ncbi:hypothetical protein VTK56DRAFT_5313 [Thermocarpiscus australiensis]
MTAPSAQRLLPETTRVEASYAELKQRLDELQRQFKLQEQHELKIYEDKLKAIDTQFRKRQEDIAHLDPALRDTFEKLLREKTDLETEAVQRTYQQQKDERKRRYDEEKQRYKDEAFKAITALMNPGNGPNLDRQATPPISRVAEPSLEPSQSAATPGRAKTPEIALAEPEFTVAEVPSPPREIASRLGLSTQVASEDERQSGSSQDKALGDAPPASPQSITVHNPDLPEETSHHAETNGQEVAEPASPVQSPTDLSAALVPAVREESILSESTASSIPARPVDKHKRKAGDESDDPSPSASGRGKRAKVEEFKINNADSVDAEQYTPENRGKAERRTISFDEVYKDGKAEHKHIIVRYPSKGGSFYILRCDEHGVHFGEHPLRGAAKHLASAQHGHMSKAHVTAIETLGHLVVDCTQELADKNNAAVMKALKEGYKPFNANHLSQTKRAEMGFPPLEIPTAQKTAIRRLGNQDASVEGSSTPLARHRKQLRTGITDPVPGKFYVACGPRGEPGYPVLILPWGSMAPVGVEGTLADTGIFGAATEDEKQPGIPKLPDCYVYEKVGGRISGIKGWASGYESGGPLVKKREFPVLCADDENCRLWSVGWIDAASLSMLDFDDPNSAKVPYFHAALEYHNFHILPHRGTDDAEARKSAGAEAPGTFTPRQAEDVEMADAKAVHNGDSEHGPGESSGNGMTGSHERRTKLPTSRSHRYAENRPVANGHSSRLPGTPPLRSATDSEVHLGEGTSDSRRTSVSNRGEPLSAQDPREGIAAKPTTASDFPVGTGDVRLIAAQALGLHSPPRNGFTPINAAPSAGHSRGASASLEPPSRRGSISNTSGNHKLVEKVDDRNSGSSQTSQGHATPANVLPERPADGAPPPGGPTSQPQIPPRKLSPASLQNILQDFPSQSVRPSRAQPQAQSPFAMQPTIVSAETRSASLPRLALFATMDTAYCQTQREDRAGSAPIQRRDEPEGEIRRAGSASAALGPTWHASPQPTALQLVQDQEQLPRALSIPPTSAGSPYIKPQTAIPLTTPSTSVFNTRANSPSQPRSSTPTVRLPKPESANQPGGTPNVDAFDVASVMEGDLETWSASAPGQFLRLVDDHETGVFSTAPGTPASLRVEPQKVKTVERMPAQGGTACIARITYNDGRTQTLVFEKARSTASGTQNGVVHARRFCRRLQAWNPDIVLPPPSSSSDSLPGRLSIGSQTPSLTPGAHAE